MKLPSINHLAHQSLLTLKRFPVVLADAVAGTVVAIVLIDIQITTPGDSFLLHRLLLTATLGLPFLIALAFFAESHDWKGLAGLGAQFFGLLLLGVYYLTLPQDVFAPPLLHVIRFWVLLLWAHLLVSFSPFAGRGHVNGFWQFNKTVFLRFLTAALYSLVLFAGLAIALAAVDHLFEIHVRPERYMQLWAVIAGVFNTWFFLSNIPQDVDALDHEIEYPKALKIFTQYILIPLVVVYLVILYAYVVKILFAWDWPKGWVANLVLGFSITGIFALLLVHPIRDRAENVWLAKFSRWYFVALVPLVPLLILSIWQRIAQYGITENRYFVILLGFWLAGIVGYFLLRRGGSIKVIPVSLCLFAALASFGPWGAFAISEKNQVSRLEGLLGRNGILTRGVVHRATGPVPFEDQREISSIVRYLHQVHTLRGIQPWFNEDLSSLGGTGETVERVGDAKAKAVVALMGIGYVGEWQTQKANFYHFAAKKLGPVDIRGYARMVRSVSAGKSTPAKIIPLNGGQLDIRQEQMALRLHAMIEGVGEDSVSLNLSDLSRGLIDRYGHANGFSIPADSMVALQSGPNLMFKLTVSELQVHTSGDSLEIQSLEGDVLIGEKR